jgi:DNA (cytosine-5)-methyltransferase 1
MPFPRKVLNHYWPNSISYEDITKTDFTIHRGAIDILTGGFPCQPYSSAGKRLGKEDERHLWPHMLRVISEVKPTYVVGENVRGLTNWNGGVVFEEVCTDLESQGYTVQPILLPACAVGAPHRRDRVWFVATNSKLCRYNRLSETSGSNKSRKKWELLSNIGHNENKIWSETERCSEIAINTNSERLKGSIPTEIIGQFPNEKSINEINLLSNGRGREELSFERFPTQPPICGGDDGLPTKLDGITFPKWRAESIKGYGNAIVPQVAYEIFKVIAEMDAREKAQLSLF